ncbi:MAG: STAS domain-containing protein [Isosphaeraceae bacterium]
MPPERLECLLFDHVAIARIRDRWPDFKDVQRIHEALRDLLAGESIRHVVLNFEAVEFFDADLRGVLLWTARELAKRDGRLALCSLPMCMRDHPTIVTFGHNFMTIVEGEDDAVRLLSSETGDAD